MTASTVVEEGFHVNKVSGIVTSEAPEYYDPEKVKPPLGVLLWVMTTGGVAIRAHWKDNAGFLAWYPLPSSPAWLKDKLYASYRGRL